MLLVVVHTVPYQLSNLLLITRQILAMLVFLLCHEHLHETFQHWKILPSRLALEKNTRKNIMNKIEFVIVSKVKLHLL